jgi:hypothetical protein
MSELDAILQQYDDTMRGDAWYGDAVGKILDGIDARCAAAQPLPAVHSIWQLVMHMEFWETVAVQRLSRKVTPDLTLNFPQTPVADEQQWKKTLERFRHSNGEFRRAISTLDPAKLDDKTPDGKYSFRWEVCGVIQHHIYHAGQISLLKKAYAEGVTSL